MKSVFHVSIYEIDNCTKRYKIVASLSKRFPTESTARQYALYMTNDSYNRGYIISEEVCDL